MQRALSGSTRRKLRLKLRTAERASPIEMTVVADIAPVIDEVYPLYLQVYHRSTLHFEKLTKEYFCGLGTRLADKSRFFIWRQNNKIIAFGSCLLQGDTIHAEYLGLDYSVALDLHMYHYTFRDLVTWGIAHGFKWFHSSALNYDPKFHLRYRLDPIDLYVRHTSTVGNAILRRILPWIEPTRYDKKLQMFANYNELWAPTDDRRCRRTATARVAPLHDKPHDAEACASTHTG
jgi:predicted N-acyltransferase